jgi:hypothetical protein
VSGTSDRGVVRHINRMTKIHMTALVLVALLGAVANPLPAAQRGSSGATALALVGDGDDGRPPRPGPTEPGGF